VGGGVSKPGDTADGSRRLELGLEVSVPFVFLVGLGHPQTSRTHFAMFTSIFMIWTIHRCSNMSFGVGRVLGSWVSVSLMKSFIAVLHFRPRDSSSSSLGGSDAEMYIISSIGGRSLGNGKRFCTSSNRDKPVDQTSALIV